MLQSNGGSMSATIGVKTFTVKLR